MELSDSHRELDYSIVLCGVVRGALEMVHLRVETRMTKCPLRGGDCTEMSITLKEILQERFHGDE